MNAQNTPPKIPSSQVEQAAQWHVLMHSGDTDADDRQAFESWLENPVNAEAYRRFETIWNRFDSAGSEIARDTLKHSLLRSRSGIHGGVLALILAIAATGYVTTPGDLLLADHSTLFEHHKVVELKDSSKLHLNALSAADVSFSRTERRILLRRGEILIDVAKDTQRPLVVATDEGTVRALGTRFIVTNEDGVTRVQVTESSVEVCPQRASSPDACTVLQAGQQTTLTQTQVETPYQVDIDSAEGWTRNQLIIDNQPLADVLAQLQRHHFGYLQFDRQSIASLRLSGVLPLDDTPKALQAIEQSLPIKVSHYSPFLSRIESVKPSKK